VAYVLRHGGLPDIDAELKQLAMDPQRSPERVCDAHVADELTNSGRCAEGPGFQPVMRPET